MHHPSRQTLAVTTPASDQKLLTIEQLRVASGLTASDTSKDSVLEELGKRVAADITDACHIAIGAGAEPTLRQETLTETLRWVQADEIVLSRRHNVEVTSIVEDGTPLSTNDFDVDPESGVLSRLRGDRPCRWRANKVVVVYKAGFETVPPGLAGAAMDLARLRLSSEAADPLEKARTVEIPDVETVRVDRWVGAVPGSFVGPVPTEIAAKLARYMNVALA